jgi:hypothetical protein
MLYRQKYGTLLSIANDRNKFKNSSKLRPQKKRFMSMLMCTTSTIHSIIHTSIHNKSEKPLNTQAVWFKTNKKENT